MRMKREKDRRAAGQEAPMLITGRMLARLIGQIIASLRGAANKARRH
jgi:hypothetical protein